jgi:hypothetical protein
MIELIQIKQDTRFVAKLQFRIAGKTPPEFIEIDHTPESDPVRTFAVEGAGATKLNGEIISPTAERVEFVVRCNQGPLFAVVDGAGLKIFVLP